MDGDDAVDGEDAVAAVLSLNAGGQFVSWAFGPASAANVFATVKIAWLFNPSINEWDTNFFPALGVVDFAIDDGAILWVVSEMAQDIVIEAYSEMAQDIVIEA